MSTNLPAVIEKKLTSKQVETAASAAGLKPDRVRKMTGRTKIGQYIENLGPGRRARGELELASETIEDLLDECKQLQKIAMEQGDLEIAAVMLHRRAQLSESLIRAAQAQLNAPDYVERVIAARPAQVFPAHIAIGVSVNQDQKKVLELPPAKPAETAVQESEQVVG